MKGDTVLDYVELQLSPPRTRCELFVSADNVVEKLASGFLKPFLTHLRAVEEQVTQGCNSVRLEHPQSLEKCQGGSWFTKGTLERFVCFVSTPEVLERVKSVEDELGQLEQVRNIQASSLRQAENYFLGADSAASKSDANVYSGVLRNGSSNPSRRYQNDAAERGAESSKIELLRAMDQRLLALQQEQSTAFGRAAAAGFNSKNMLDLIAFSEHFGAERLRTACVNFLAVLQTRHAQSTHADLGALSSGSGMFSRNALTGLDVESTQSPQIDVQERSHHSEDDTNDLVFISSSKGSDFNSWTSRGSGGMEVRKRWGPPQNIRSNLYVDQNETDSISSNTTSNGVSVNGSPEVQSSMKETPIVNIEQEMGKIDALFGNIASETDLPMSSAQGKNVLKAVSAGHVNLKESLEACVDCKGGASQLSSSVERRSSLPLIKASTESSLPSHTSFSLQEPLTEKNRAVKSSNEESERQKVGEDVVGSETSSTPIVAPARRLSVQDAISLFENKQRRDSIDSSGKHCPGKPESNRISIEGSGVSSFGNTALRRWDSGKGLQACMVSQENQILSKHEANFCPAHASEDTLVGSASLNSTESSQERHGAFLAQPLSGAPIKALSYSQWQPSVPSASAKVEAATGKDLAHHRESVSSEGGKDALEGDWRKQFKLQLEKSLAKELFTKDLPVKDDLQKTQSGIILPKKSLNHVKIDQSKSNSTGPLVTAVSGSRSKETLEKGGISLEQRQPLLMQGTLGLKTLPVAYDMGQNDLDKPEMCLPGFKKTEPMDTKEGGKNDIASLLVISDNATDQSSGRESLGSSLVNPLDHDTQALVTLADHQIIEGDKDPSGLKGRFYEQYRKLRDAKLMEDQDSKRAEREAKLKVMEATLTRRKAELDAQSGRPLKNGVNQIHATKVEADLNTSKKEQQDGGHEGNRSFWKDQAKPIISSPSPPLTPYTSKEMAATSKSQGVRKAGAVVPQKGATPPRSNTRPTPSVSPKLVPRSTTAAAASSLRKSVASSATDNPLARSVPCFANLRKENTKPSLGRPSGSARVHPKNGGSGRMRGVNEATPLEANVNVPAQTYVSRNGLTKEDQKPRSSLMRKSCATASDFKDLSLSSDDGVLAPLKSEREMKTEAVANNKLRRAVGPFQEAKPFLRKGRGIRPGTGPGMIKQQVSSAAGAAKTSNEEIATSQIPEPNNADGGSPVPEEISTSQTKISDEEFSTSQTPEPNNGDGGSQVLEEFLSESNSRELSEMENMNLGEDAPLGISSADNMVEQVIGTVGRMFKDSEEAILDISAEKDTSMKQPIPDNLHDIMERACHTISLPIDNDTHNRYAVKFDKEIDSNPLFDPDSFCSKEDIETVSQHEEVTVGSLEDQLDEASTSLHTSSLPHEHDKLVLTPVPLSPLSSSVDQYDQLSPISAVKLESPCGSPASWNSSQLQYTNVTQLNKKWVACQKPVVPSHPPKETVRGFKRLLKFGRKSRASELATADCISASTTSEGDDESEDQNRFIDEVSSTVRLQYKKYDNVQGYHHNVEDEGSALNVRSSIPTPPVNFRLCDDHMSGGTMLKAPRSFFSLSSFRSKGSEGKLR